MRPERRVAAAAALRPAGPAAADAGATDER
jgi:hypothetical protein